MDPDDFHHVNGTYGDVEDAKAWGNPIRIAKAKKEAEYLKQRAICEATALLKKYGYHVTPPDAPTHEVPRELSD
jgi:hypothetical protein